MGLTSNDNDFGVLKQHFQILLLPHYLLDFQACIPVALCTLQNFIQETDHDEDAIPTDPYQAVNTPFPSDINDDYDYGSDFIADDDDEANSIVKLHRKNIANEMWRSYMIYMEDTENGTQNT